MLFIILLFIINLLILQPLLLRGSRTGYLYIVLVTIPKTYKTLYF